MEAKVRKVLIVDDNPEFSTFLKDILEENAFECTIALTPRDALKYIEQALPDIILLDLMLPEMSGHGLMRILQKSDHTASIPVIALSALKDDDVIAEMFDLGVTEYLPKSCSVKRLVSTVESIAS